MMPSLTIEQGSANICKGQGGIPEVKNPLPRTNCPLVLVYTFTHQKALLGRDKKTPEYDLWFQDGEPDTNRRKPVKNEMSQKAKVTRRETTCLWASPAVSEDSCWLPTPICFKCNAHNQIINLLDNPCKNSIWQAITSNALMRNACYANVSHQCNFQLVFMYFFKYIFLRHVINEHTFVC